MIRASHFAIYILFCLLNILDCLSILLGQWLFRVIGRCTNYLGHICRSVAVNQNALKHHLCESQHRCPFMKMAHNGHSYPIAAPQIAHILLIYFETNLHILKEGWGGSCAAPKLPFSIIGAFWGSFFTTHQSRGHCLSLYQCRLHLGPEHTLREAFCSFYWLTETCILKWLIYTS